jgi:hypothetical protein
MAVLVADPMSMRMSGCATGCSRASRTRSGWGSGCSSAAASPRGRALRSATPARPAPPPRPAADLPGDARGLVDALATIAPPCASAG